MPMNLALIAPAGEESTPYITMVDESTLEQCQTDHADSQGSRVLDFSQITGGSSVADPDVAAVEVIAHMSQVEALYAALQTALNEAMEMGRRFERSLASPPGQPSEIKS